jgi:hypothetical protein
MGTGGQIDYGTNEPKTGTLLFKFLSGILPSVNYDARIEVEKPPWYKGTKGIWVFVGSALAVYSKPLLIV